MNISPFIITFSGKEFHYLDSSKQPFDVSDMAHALSVESRFSGHCKTNWTVGQHLLAGYRYSLKQGKRKKAIAMLFHDAQEAYMKDIPTPLKSLIPEYKKIEKEISTNLYKWVGLKIDDSFCKKIKEIDNLLYDNEFFAVGPKYFIDGKYFDANVQYQMKNEQFVIDYELQKIIKILSTYSNLRVKMELIERMSEEIDNLLYDNKFLNTKV